MTRTERNAFAGSATATRYRLAVRLMCGSALAGIGLFASAALAQPSAEQPETVTVTGTSIRGVAPVGSNVITLDRSDMDAIGASTVDELIQNVPQISGFGNDGAEFSQSAHSSTGESAPTIHNLGASSSQSTLILIDGHNFTPSNGYEDPGIIPGIAIQRIDVLADGDSAIYGSNAVAGVINFVTRKDYEGFQTQVQYGSAADYNTTTIGELFGHTWDTGSVMAAYEYHSNSLLTANDRSYTRHADLTGYGGTNFNTFNCTPATIAASNAGTANVYTAPYTGAPVTTAGNVNGGVCDSSGVNGLEPSATTNAVLVKFTQQFTDRLRVGLDYSYFSRVNFNQNMQSSINATAFGPTGSSPALGTASQNPFYIGNAATGTASEYVRYDLTGLVGPQQLKLGQHEDFANLSATYDLGSDWTVDLNAFGGWNQSFTHSSNIACTACALLALNGTVNSTGAAVTSASNSSLSDTYQLGTTTNITRPLNTTNALDVWTAPGAGNRTPKQVVTEIANNFSDYDDESNLNDVRLKFDGPLFSLPAGKLRVATGGEYYMTHDTSLTATSDGAGPTNSNTRLLYVPLKRTVYSAFAEFFIPAISPEMHIPLVMALNFDLAARYDQYSDVGATRNPRMGFTWDVVDGLKLRGNYGTSFTAPNPQYLSTVLSGSVSSSTATFTVPPNDPQIYAGSVCPNPNNCSFNSTTPGLSTSVGNPNLKPMTGQTYSAGIEISGGDLWKPLQGLLITTTYWQVKFQGGLTAVTLQNDLTLAGLQNLLTLAPAGGWTPSSPAVVAAIAGNAVTSNLPPVINYIAVTGRRNAFNIWANGIDFDTKYVYSTTSAGDFTFDAQGTEKLRFDLQGGPAGSTAPIQNYLNGVNETSTIKATQFEGRGSVRWQFDPFDINLAMNYTGAYWYLNTNYPYSQTTYASPAGFPGGGFEHIGANITFDLYGAYTLPNDWLYGLSRDTKLALAVHNIMNAAPPFHDSGPGNFNTYTTGYDQYNASPIGRLIQVSLVKKW